MSGILPIILTDTDSLSSTPLIQQQQQQQQQYAGFTHEMAHVY